jgi:hypothetical protein
MWRLDTETETLFVSGKGAIFDYESAAAQPWNKFTSQIKQIEIEDGITDIGAHSFEGCSELLKISLPNTITSVGSYAFYKCTDLNSVTLMNQVTSIGSCAFGKCTDLEFLTILNVKCIIDDDKNTISDTTEIFSYTDSTAQKYAKKYNRPFTAVYLGDGSMNEKVNLLDAMYAMLIYDHSSEDIRYTIYEEPEREQFAENLMDVDGNNQITLEDAQYIMQYYLYQLAGYNPSWNEILE